MTLASFWDADQLERYGRQILVPGIGGRGQQRLANSRVVVIGTGSLAELVGTALARVGIGTIDVEPSLARQLQGSAAPDCKMTAAEPPRVLSGSTELVIDTALSALDWHQRLEELAQARWILWLREQAGCGYVATWQPKGKQESCPCWVFRDTQGEETVATKFEQSAAVAWAAAWASALAVRLLTDAELSGPPKLYWYRVRSGEVAERLSSRGNRCEYRNAGPG